MEPCRVRKRYLFPLMLALMLPVLAACGAPAPVAQQTPQIIRETVIVQAPTQPPQIIRETVIVRETAAPTLAATAAATTTAVAAGAFTTPHPVLGDVKVRQAIAYCTNRPELIKALYPFLDAQQQSKLQMDTNLPQGHWALATEGITKYPFDPAKGNALLEEAGWKLGAGKQLGKGAVRAKSQANGDALPLALKFTTTNAQFRQTYATVLEKQLLDNCGIQIVRTHAPASYWFGATTGLARRDFELGAFAWVGSPDPGGSTLYACNQIPLPTNNWEGQNYMGWCNDKASKAIIAANNKLDRESRKKDYAVFQQEFTKDMVSLPLFNRLEAAAANKNLQNFKPDPTDYVTANAGDWQLQGGGSSVVMGFTQEPASLFTLVEDAAVAAMAKDLITARTATTYGYDYQPVMLKRLPTIENGGATNMDVDVKAGDKVWSTEGKAVPLAPGVEVVNTTGETVKYTGAPLKMKQLKVTFDFVPGIKWEDGQPLKKADFELAAKINCAKESGATSFQVCESRQKVDFTSDTSYTVTYLPGSQWPEYFVQTVGAYPSHQVVAGGRKLADVPAKEWATLPEIAEKPLSNGPYKLVEWTKGQRMVFEANPNYFKGAPKVKRVTIQFFADTNQAVAQLLTGDVDILEPATLGAGPEVETVLKAGKDGKIQAVAITSPTWEHMDMNLFTK